MNQRFSLKKIKLVKLEKEVTEYKDEILKITRTLGTLDDPDDSVEKKILVDESNGKYCIKLTQITK